MITSTDYAGRACILTHNGQPVNAGEILEDFRGDQCRVTGGQAPHKASSSGKIYTDAGNYYPTVFNCEWTPAANPSEMATDETRSNGPHQASAAAQLQVIYEQLNGALDDLHTAPDDAANTIEDCIQRLADIGINK